VSAKRKQRKLLFVLRDILLPLSITQENPMDPMSLVRTPTRASTGKDTKYEFPAHDQSADNISTGYGQQILEKRNAEVSETIIVSNLKAMMALP